MYSYNKTPFTQVVSGLKESGYILTVQMKYANDTNEENGDLNSIQMQPRRNTLKRANSDIFSTSVLRSATIQNIQDMLASHDKTGKRDEKKNFQKKQTKKEMKILRNTIRQQF